jgi:antitoxin component of MazEF toxin-antitoxin module
MNNYTYEDNEYQAIVGKESFSILLPRRYAMELGLQHAQFIKVRKNEGKIIIEKA